MGWMNDTLEYIQKSPKERENDPNKITFPMMYNYSENFILPFSHDEVVHLKKPLVWKSTGNESEQFSNLRLLFTYFFGHPGKKLMFMGGEFAETSEWAEDRALHWHLLDHKRHQGIKKLVDDLNRLYKKEESLHQLDKDPNGFEWIALGKEQSSVFSFLRKAKNPANHLLFILNFSDREVSDYSVGPFKGEQYRLVFNSESEYYGGTNNGGHYGLGDEQHVWMEPYSALVLKPESELG
jgi:1,4-alpha-glucan branching enzyme